MQIKEFLEKFGNKKKIKKGTYLYKKDSNNTNLYYVVSGEIILLANSNEIALIGKNEINGEKSFLENKGKNIDAYVKEDGEVLYMTLEKFNKIDYCKRNSFLSSLTLSISNRVDFLNDIISNLSYLNEKILSKEIDLSLDGINKFFKFIDLKNIYVYKILGENDIIPIFESQLNLEVQNRVRYCTLSDNLDLLREGDMIAIKLTDYILVLEGKSKLNEYVVNNILIHSSGVLKYFCILLEEKKNQDLSEFL